MAEESGSPDLVELVRVIWTALNRRDPDAILSVAASDAVWETRGVGTFEGPAAVRGFWADWMETFEEPLFEVEKVLNLGAGVAFAGVGLQGHPAGSASSVEWCGAFVYQWAGAMLARITTYRDIDEGREAAERLAEERE